MPPGPMQPKFKPRSVLSYAAIKQRERRYPIWSTRIIVSCLLLAMGVTLPLTLIFGHHRLLVSFEITLAVVAAVLFMLLTVGLYRGVRVKKREALTDDVEFYNGGNLWEQTGDSSSGWDVAGSADDPLGCLVAILFAIFGTALLVLLLVIFANVFIIFLFLFLLALGWIFHRAFRTVFAKSKRCRGDLAASLAYGGMYTLLYTGWLFVALFAADRFIRR